jgi:hypothetical protein
LQSCTALSDHHDSSLLSSLSRVSHMFHVHHYEPYLDSLQKDHHHSKGTFHIGEWQTFTGGCYHPCSHDSRSKPVWLWS